MLNHQFTDAQLNPARYAVENSHRIKGSAEKLTAALQKLFSSGHPKAHWGVTYMIGEDKIAADIDTPFGGARARLLIGIDDKGVRGRYVIEKATLDKYDKTLWHPVLSFRVSEHGEIIGGDGEGPSLEIDHPFNGANIVGAVGLSILTAVGRGPELSN